MTPNSATLLTAGETVQLSAAALDQNGATMTGQSFTWSSSDDGVATVSSSGLATAAGPNGSVTVSATTAGISGTANVDVVASPAGGTLTASNGAVTLTIPQGSLSAPVTITVVPFPSIPAEAGLVAGSVFEFGPDGTTFDPPAILTLVYDETALPAGLDEQSLTLLTERPDGSWEELESSTVTVDAGANTVTGSITGFSGKGSGSKVATVDLTPTNITLRVGATADIQSILRNALGHLLMGRWVRWTSSDKTIAEVRPSPTSTTIGVGEVTAVAVGQVVITARSGGVSATATVTVTAAPVFETLAITTTSLPDGTPGVAYSATLAATGGDGSYTWSVTAGSLPTGLSLNVTTGEISGTPTGSGSTFTVQVASADGQTATQQLTISISISLAVVTQSLPNGTQGVAYSETLTATGGDGNYTWSLASGSLPEGLTLNATTGEISGTPTGSGSTFTVQVASADGQTATQQLTITISLAPPLITTTSPMPTGTVGAAYSQTLAASGGDGNYTWALLNATVLPAGLALNTATGLISGTPTTLGTTNFEVEVTSAGQTATTQLSITVVDAGATVTLFIQPPKDNGINYGAPHYAALFTLSTSATVQEFRWWGSDASNATTAIRFFAENSVRGAPEDNPFFELLNPVVVSTLATGVVPSTSALPVFENRVILSGTPGMLAGTRYYISISGPRFWLNSTDQGNWWFRVQSEPWRFAPSDLAFELLGVPQPATAPDRKSEFEFEVPTGAIGGPLSLEARRRQR